MATEVATASLQLSQVSMTYPDPAPIRNPDDPWNREWGGGSVITGYQYSVDGGRAWSALKKGSRSITVAKLAKDRAYSVTARALNAFGPSVSSSARRVVTRS